MIDLTCIKESIWKEFWNKMAGYQFEPGHKEQIQIKFYTYVTSSVVYVQRFIKLPYHTSINISGLGSSFCDL